MESLLMKLQNNSVDLTITGRDSVPRVGPCSQLELITSACPGVSPLCPTSVVTLQKQSIYD